MAELDAIVLANLAVRAGLLTPNQVEEGWEEVGRRGGEPEPFCKALERKGYLTPWQSFKLLKQDRDGYFLGGYRILYKIASGSFGRVYRADDPRSGRIVAIKVLRKKWSEDKHNIELFEREGRIGMTFKHPNIVEIISVNCDPGSKQYYIVMEFVEGGNLKDFLGIRKKLEAGETLRIIEDIASGLQHALSKGLTHRDMKLTNILISSQLVAKLVDFGLAGAFGKQVEREDINVDRTVDYAGLEKATNVPPGDTRSDIFFLGCVGYELLTGRRPLAASKNPRERMQPDRFLRIPPIRPEEVKAPPSAIRLIQTMMSLNPHERFQTPSQLLDAVREVRREMEGKTSVEQRKDRPKTLFLVEKDERLQDILRDKLKAQGYRVLLSGDPVRALDRYRQQPFDFLILNAGTAGEDGLFMFERIMNEAEKMHIFCGGIVLLNEDQADWSEKIRSRPGLSVLVQPIKFKQLVRTLQEMKAPE